MKALSIKQPWAWLIVNGHKSVENRDWDTRFRGEFYVHAGKAFDKAGYQWVRVYFPEIDMPSEPMFERGGIVGKARIINTISYSEQRLLTKKDKPWFFGDYGFILDEAQPLPFMPLKGQLGFFNAEYVGANNDQR